VAAIDPITLEVWQQGWNLTQQGAGRLAGDWSHRWRLMR
jgi:hypothetical protein